MKILITCPYSFNYRNYVYSGFVEKLLSMNMKVYILLPSVLLRDPFIVELKNKYSNFLFLEPIKQDYTFLEKIVLILLRSWCYKIQNTKTYKLKNKNLKKIDFKEWVKYYALSLFLPKSVYLYKKTLNLTKSFIFYSRDIYEFIRVIDPEVYISTLHNKYNEGKYIYACDKLSIRTIGVVHSWDVITTKGFFPVSTNETLFWSKANMLAYEKYVEPLSRPTKKTVIGVIHFDCYFGDINKTEAKAKLKLPYDKKVILYSTSVKRLVPNEESIILNMINKMKENEDIFFYIRIHPQADTNEFSRIPHVGENFIVDRPEKSGQKELQDKVMFSENTFSKLMLSIISSDLVINVASSMALDSLALNRPVIWLKEDGMVMNYYNYEHIQDVLTTLPINLCEIDSNLERSIISTIKKYNYNTRRSFEKEFAKIGCAQENLINIINGS